MGIKTFHLERLEDESGVSGTGRVAEGAIFTNGRCVLVWLSAMSSMTMFDSVDNLEKIHGHGGKTLVVYHDE